MSFSILCRAVVLQRIIPKNRFVQRTERWFLCANSQSVSDKNLFFFKGMLSLPALSRWDSLVGSSKIFCLEKSIKLFPFTQNLSGWGLHEKSLPSPLPVSSLVRQRRYFQEETTTYIFFTICISQGIYVSLWNFSGPLIFWTFFVLIKMTWNSSDKKFFFAF